MGGTEQGANVDGLADAFHTDAEITFHGPSICCTNPPGSPLPAVKQGQNDRFFVVGSPSRPVPAAALSAARPPRRSHPAGHRPAEPPPPGKHLPVLPPVAF